MNFQIIIIALSMMFLFGQSAKSEGSKSGLFIEPSLTYEIGSTSVEYPTPLSSSTGSADGFGLGIKFGFHISEAIFIAGDGRYSMPLYKDSSVAYDAKSIARNWGPVLGFQMPDMGLRIWGGLVLGGELNPEKSGTFDVFFKKASGYRVGTGFRISSVSLNLEYQQVKYDETTLEAIGPFTPGSTFNNVSLENKSWIASVSFPMEL